MKIIMLRLVAVTVCICFLQSGFSQAIDSVMSLYEARTPKEKIHIHFDRTVYNKDETIWYKVYVLAGYELTPLSKNVYVEWYDTTGRMIRQTVAPLFQSTAKGSFELPAGYSGNSIHVKAYTRWMLNDDTAFIFQKDILFNATVSAAVKPVVVPKTRVDVFPEAGLLVQGLSNRVAFKATNQFGTPVFIKGAVYSGKKYIDTLLVKHDGMGSFFITPQPGETYQLNWTDENGKKGTTAVEPAKPEGVTMSVQATNDKAFVQLQRTKGIPETFKKLNLWVHMNQGLLYKVSVNLSEKNAVKAEIPIDELPTGILQFTLFSEDMQPVGERILFVNNRQHEFNAKVTLALVNLEKRGKNVIDIMVSDTAFTNMSVAITDASITIPETQSIYSDILLSSEIRGKVHNPAYYLSTDADSVTANLDLVMMTHGWRRFNWDKVKAGVLPEMKYPLETDFLKITGKVYGFKPNSTAAPPQLNFVLRGKDSSTRFVFAPIERDGSFSVPNQFFYDTVKAFYSFNNNSKLTEVTQVQLENGLLRFVPKKITLPASNPLGLWNDSLARIKMNYIFNEQEKLRKLMASTTLAEVTVKAKTKSPLQVLEEKYATGLFSGGDGFSFDPNENGVPGAMDIFAYLQGRVPGLTVSGSGPQTTLSWRGSSPDVYLNEMVTPINMVSTINVNDVAFIKVFRPPFFGSGGGGAGGAIAIYLKKGGATKSDPNAKGMESTILGGYSRFKEFFSPSYEKDSNPDPDLRSTIYWNPYVMTNKKSPRIRLQFFNNDITKKFLLVLEGINGNGKMTRVVKEIDAKSQD